MRTASTGERGLELALSGSFDLLLSDVVMPGMNGYELCRAVKDDPRIESLPVVLLTSLSDPLDVVNGLEAGADNFIRKPYDPEQLISRLRTVLLNRELRSTGNTQMGLELSFLDRRFVITADRQQILDLLISTFEELVVTARQVLTREEELVRAHAAVQEQVRAMDIERRRLEAVLDAAPVPMVVIDGEGRVTDASRRAADLFGLRRERMQGLHTAEVAHFVDPDGHPLPAETRPLLMAVNSGKSASAGTAFDVLLQRPDGSLVHTALYAEPVSDEHDTVVGAVGTVHLLGDLALRDPLTGLLNHAAFNDRVTHLVTGPHGTVAILLIALDRFDVVRGSFGSRVADQVLSVLARRLCTVVAGLPTDLQRDVATAAYLGNDQFGVVLPDIADQTDPLRLAESVRSELARPCEVDGRLFRVTAAVGISVGEESTREPAGLLAPAGSALRQARDAGGDTVVLLGAAASREAIERLQLEHDLRRAAEDGELTLHYQPQVDLANGSMVGVEALARWRHAQLGAISPDVFIRMAEESGLILPLGRHLLHEACRQARAWQLAGIWPTGMRLAVNLSAAQLRQDLVSEVLVVLGETGLPPSDLILELTETAAMREPEVTVVLVEALRGHGVQFALDDFGTGYSSLAYLNRIRFDQLKLDRGFVAGILAGETDMAIAQSVIALGRSLGVKVMAEGIEQQAQVQTLLGLGCELGQGYHLGLPVAAPAMEEFLHTVRRASDPGARVS